MSTLSFSNNLYLKSVSGTNMYSLDNLTWNNFSSSSYPVTLSYTGPLAGVGNVFFVSNLRITSSSQYFIIGTNNITIDGQNNEVEMSGVTLYGGLFQNGKPEENGKNNITIKNISIIIYSGSPSLIIQGGWVCCRHFGKGAASNTLDNLRSNCVINTTDCGGICGRETGTNGSLTINNCHSTGGIVGSSCGGICSSFCGRNGGNILISNCSSSGDLNPYATFSGGIVGSDCANAGTVTIIDCNSSGIIANRYGGGGICAGSSCRNGGTLTINNCYSTGIISNSTGGICGEYVGQRGTVTITDCYSSGIISGNYSGGIVGSYFGIYNSDICQINNCYSTGLISGNYSGGITGIQLGYDSNSIIQINNCHSTGDITGLNAGGIVGAEISYVDDVSYTPQVSINDCYSTGTVSSVNTCGAICGGTIGNIYAKNVNVTLSSIQSTFEPIISPTLQSSVIFTQATQETVLTDFIFVPSPSIVGQLITIIPPTSNREGEFIYSSSDTSIAQIVDNTYIYCLKQDSVDITAIQPSIDGWTEGIITTPLYIVNSTSMTPTPVSNSLQLNYALSNNNTLHILITNNILNLTSLINVGTNKKYLISNSIIKLCLTPTS